MNYCSGVPFSPSVLLSAYREKEQWLYCTAFFLVRLMKYMPPFRSLSLCLWQDEKAALFCMHLQEVVECAVTHFALHDPSFYAEACSFYSWQSLPERSICRFTDDPYDLTSRLSYCDGSVTLVAYAVGSIISVM